MSQFGQFQIVIVGQGKHGCARHTSTGESLYRRRCERLSCIDCLTFDFVQTIRQKGYRINQAEFTHHFGAVNPEVLVIDDLIDNIRLSGQFELV